MATATNSNGTGLGLLIVAGALAWAAHSGIFYQTGKEWFDTCWTAQHSKDGPKTPEEAAAWGKCNFTTNKSLFDAGFAYSGNPEYAVTPQLKAMVKACPSNYSDIPLDGIDRLAVRMVEQHGGATFVDGFLPASSLIVKTFETRWPDCPAVRSANGFPKLVEKDGDFGWETPCQPCQAEQAARNR